MLGFRVQGLGSRVPGFRVQRLGFRGQRSGFRVRGVFGCFGCHFFFELRGGGVGVNGSGSAIGRLELGDSEAEARKSVGWASSSCEVPERCESLLDSLTCIALVLSLPCVCCVCIYIYIFFFYFFTLHIPSPLGP